MSLLTLPPELLEAILQQLPVYDQLFTFGSVSSLLRNVTFDFNIRADRRRWRLQDQPLTDNVIVRHGKLSHNAIVIAATDRTICAMDTGHLVCWPTTGELSEYPSTKRKISFDTQALVLPDQRTLLTWNYHSIAVYELSLESFPNPMVERRLVGRKKFTALAPQNNSTTLLWCTVDNFGQRYAELLALRGPSRPQTIHFWPGGFKAFDTMQDGEQQIHAAITDDDRAIVRVGPNTEKISCSRIGAAFVALRFIPAGNRLAACCDSGQVVIFDARPPFQEMFILGQSRRGSYFRCIDLSYDTETDRLLCLSQTTEPGCIVKQEIHVWNMETRDEVMLFSVDSREVSRLEIIGWHSSVAGIVILLNGKIHCLTPGSSHRPVVGSTLKRDEYIVSGRIKSNSSASLTIGCSDGTVWSVLLPTRVEMMDKTAQNWSFPAKLKLSSMEYS